MKYMIISDIHGSCEWTQRAVEQFENCKADHLIILGDVLYHGPRNSLPDGHDTKETAHLLNKYADKIISVRGNCEAEVDQLMLTFPCMADYLLVVDNGRRMLLSHGHLFDESNFPFKLERGSIYFSGHTHIWRLEEKNGIVLCNPGSVSLPKTKTLDESPIHSFAIYENNEISIVSLENPKEILSQYVFDTLGHL
ncbi:MAG: phosphodiesterase [Termitinemataceae bacterium]|nr:MAG: phosphodiesterase [Termitinemataceae bacterium]